MSTCKPIKRIPIKQAEYARNPSCYTWQAEINWRYKRYRQIYGVKKNDK